MQLIIRNKIITEPIELILMQVRKETMGKYYSKIIDKGDNLMVTCPFHKDGQENNPSCSVVNTDELDKIPRGWHYCFTCGSSYSLAYVIGRCFDRDELYGEQWLIDRYGNVFLEKQEILPEISLKTTHNDTKYLSEDILSKYDYYHDYMWYRGLTKPIVDKFRVGFDKERNMITFPVWSLDNKLVMVTGRNVFTKQFYLEKDVEKPVYLLNFMVRDNVKTLYICESQINALYLNGLGYPAVALFGTGTTTQYKILRKSGIRNFILCFDGDSAGRHGANRFKKEFEKDCMITDVILPSGKDVNDLKKEEIIDLFSKYVKIGV